MLAIRAAQLGKRVACVEKERAGGTCLNWGCIPTKPLLRNAELYHLMKHRAADFGFKIEGLSFDWSKVIGRSRDVSDKNAAGIEFLFKKNKVDYLRGEASLENAGEVFVRLAEGETETHKAERILVATGVVSRPMPGSPFDGKKVIGSREAMILESQPKSMVIIGAGAIGVECAYFVNAFGTKVTLIENVAQRSPGRGHRGVADAGEGAQATGNQRPHEHEDDENRADEEGCHEGKTTETIEAEICLAAIGVTLLLPNGKLKPKSTERGNIETNDRYETSLPNVYAAGDIIGPPWSGHVASWEAI